MQTEKEIAQSKTVKIKSISIIWLVPFIALLIGIWMLYFQLSNQGSLVTISFKNGEGIEAGKTKIKVKNVQVGTVKKIELNDNLDGVIVSARIHNKDNHLLVDDSDFWVVRPKISKGGITGLSTLISGAYIELSPGASGKKKYHFTGLENAPLTPAGSPGLHITLSNSGDHALQVGDAILYRGIKVGRIEYVYFNTIERIVYYNAFIKSPYDNLITSNTKFWRLNGFEINVSADGIQVQSGTLETLISGGVTFDVPAGMPYGNVITKRTEFTIYPDKNAINDSLYKKGLRYILLFKASIRGLKTGAPIEFRGVKIGSVIRTDINYPQMKPLLEPDSLIPVMITINPVSIGYKGNKKSLTQAKNDIHSLLKKGLYGRIANASLLTGSKYITLQYAKTPINNLKNFNGYPVIPTRKNPLDQIITRFAGLLKKINHLPLEKTLKTTDITLQQITDTLKDVDKTSRQMEKLLKQSTDENLVTNMNAAVLNIKKLLANLSNGSGSDDEITNTLRTMQSALTELKSLLIKLNQNPNSFIFGQQQKKDIEPEGRQQ